AEAAIEAIAARGRRPILVGGSGLYIRALLQGLIRGLGADPALRARIAARVEREGAGAIRERLRAVDPEAARRIHANDTYRMTRALEVYEQEGVPLSRLQSAHAWRGGRFEPTWVGLTEERPVLYARIE